MKFDDFCDFVVEEILCHLKVEDLANVSDTSKRLRGLACSVFSRVHSSKLISFDATSLVPWEAECKIQSITRISNANNSFKALRNFGEFMKNIRIESDPLEAKRIRGPWNRMFSYFSRYLRLDSIQALELRNRPDFPMDKPMPNMQQFFGHSQEIKYTSVHLMPNLRVLSLSKMTKSLDKHFPLLENVRLVLFDEEDLNIFISFISKNRQIRVLRLDADVEWLGRSRIELAIVEHLQQRENVEIISYGQLNEELYAAAANGNIDRVKTVVNLDANYISEALYLAAKNGHFECVKFLHGKGANININHQFRCIPLHIAICLGHLNVVEYLIENKADIHSKDEYGRTAMHWASLYGHLKVAEYLVEKGAAIDDKDIYGGTALFFAVYNGYLGVAKFLVENGEDINNRTDCGHSLLDYALAFDNIQMAKCLKDLGAQAFTQLDKYEQTFYD